MRAKSGAMCAPPAAVDAGWPATRHGFARNGCALCAGLAGLRIVKCGEICKFPDHTSKKTRMAPLLSTNEPNRLTAQPERRLEKGAAICT